MDRPIGQQALVVGAGIGGLATARVLADYFDRVIVAERDVLPENADARAGVPQSRHVHGLLAGGQQALATLFPGFAGDLEQAGAVRLHVSIDTRLERPGYDPFPQRDFGFHTYALSRPLLERCVRHRVERLSNVEFWPRCRVRELLPDTDGNAVIGATCQMADGTVKTVDTQVVVDASGQGTLTLNAITSLGQILPEQTVIGVDRTCASAVFAMPEDASRDWKAVVTFPQGRGNGYGALMLPIEGQRWMLTIGGPPDEEIPADLDKFMGHVQGLRTPTVYEAINNTPCLSEISRFRFPESVYRHYDRLTSFPRGILPLGDAMCRFNPLYGQGMSVAAQEAVALAHLLAEQVTASDPLDGLGLSYFSKAAALLEAPWAMASLADFASPTTRGERPPDFRQRLQIGMATTKLAFRDPAVHKLVVEVAHLLKPRHVLQTPELQQRIQAVMAEG